MNCLFALTLVFSLVCLLSMHWHTHAHSKPQFFFRVWVFVSHCFLVGCVCNAIDKTSQDTLILYFISSFASWQNKKKILQVHNMWTILPFDACKNLYIYLNKFTRTAKKSHHFTAWKCSVQRWASLWALVSLSIWQNQIPKSQLFFPVHVWTVNMNWRIFIGKVHSPPLLLAVLRSLMWMPLACFIMWIFFFKAKLQLLLPISKSSALRISVSLQSKRECWLCNCFCCHNVHQSNDPHTGREWKKSKQT